MCLFVTQMNFKGAWRWVEEVWIWRWVGPTDDITVLNLQDSYAAKDFNLRGNHQKPMKAKPWESLHKVETFSF